MFIKRLINFRKLIGYLILLYQTTEPNQSP